MEPGRPHKQLPGSDGSWTFVDGSPDTAVPLIYCGPKPITCTICGVDACLQPWDASAQGWRTVAPPKAQWADVDVEAWTLGDDSFAEAEAELSVVHEPLRGSRSMTCCPLCAGNVSRVRDSIEATCAVREAQAIQLRQVIMAAIAKFNTPPPLPWNKRAIRRTISKGDQS